MEKFANPLFSAIPPGLAGQGTTFFGKGTRHSKEDVPAYPTVTDQSGELAGREERQLLSCLMVPASQVNVPSVLIPYSKPPCYRALTLRVKQRNRGREQGRDNRARCIFCPVFREEAAFGASSSSPAATLPTAGPRGRRLERSICTWNAPQKVLSLAP